MQIVINDCKICHIPLKNSRGLATHLRIKHHNISIENYVIQYYYNGVHPLCNCGCQKETNFMKGGKFRYANFLVGHKTQEMRNQVEFKRKETVFRKYGTLSTLQIPEVAEKSKITTMEKYGSDHFSKSSHFAESVKKSTQTKYGVDWYTQSSEYKNKHYQRLKFIDVLKYCKNKKYEALFAEVDYNDNRDILNFRCLVHDKIFTSKMVYVQKETSQCPTCKGSNTSKPEKEIADFVSSLGVEIVENTRSVIPPLELDIYIPSKNIAIEFNGLYWHCEINKEKDYHYKKFLKCKENGVQLLQFWEDEWRDKSEICKNIIRHKLGLSQKYNARDFVVNENPDKIKVKEFFEANHLQGNGKFTKAFSLEKDNQIYACMTFRKPFTKQTTDTIEVGRFAASGSIRGGFDRLFKYGLQWVREMSYKSILTYSDCRISLGQVYERKGFQFAGHSGLSYDYTDLNSRFGRFTFRAQPNKTEKQVAEENEVYKLYGPGNYRWSISI